VKRIVLLALGVSLLPGSDGGLCTGADWPRYRGPNGDGIAPDVKLPAVWPKSLKPRWAVSLGEGFSSPAVAKGRVFVLAQAGHEEEVRCLDARTGKHLWRRSYRARYVSGLAGNGPRATATVDGDRVYTVGAAGDMRCLSVTDGAVLWQASFKAAFRFRRPTYGLSPSPLIDGERVIVHTGARDGASVVALNKRTGTVIWSSQSDPAGYASPMIVAASETRGPRQLIVFTRHALISLNPDTGALHWRYPWRTSYEQNIAQPMLEGDLLTITSLTGFLGLRLTRESGKPTYRKAWRNNNMAAHFSCPVTRDGYLYGLHGRRAELRCIDLKDGSVVWSQGMPARQRGGIVLADTCLLIYTDRGRLVVADASPKGYHERARYDIAGRNWVPPVVAAGDLFLRDHSSLRCIPLPAP